MQPDQLADLVLLAKEAPDTVFILDHCGGHQGLKKTNLEQNITWQNGVIALSKLPNVVAKVSGLYGGWDGGVEDWSLKSQAFTMNFIMDMFPDNRVVFGGDWPVCELSAPIAEYIIGTKRMVVKTRGRSYAMKLFSENAKHWYKLNKERNIYRGIEYVPPEGLSNRIHPSVNVPNEYKIIIGRGLLETLPLRVSLLVPAAKYIIVTDKNIYDYYGKDLARYFEEYNIPAVSITVPPGENSKCRKIKASIEDYMLKKRCNRDSCILAFGGGVIGDLAGYVASTYMRGIPYVQVPTSLLAMVDSSIGGKTGIDTPAGKNLIGAFHNPRAVFIDLEVLKTLPLRELSNGMAEAIKKGAIRSDTLFSLIENSPHKVFSYDLETLGCIIHSAASIKAYVVREDYREKGLRSILNYGHSIGHAIETYMQPKLLHGECIAIGMVKEAELSQELGYLKSPAEIRRLIKCLRSYRLPTVVPSHLETDAILKTMEVDKKNKNGKLKVILLKEIGTVKLDPVTIMADKIKLILSQSRQSRL